MFIVQGTGKIYQWVSKLAVLKGSTREAISTSNLVSAKIWQKALFKLVVCYYHVTYAFGSESTLYSCLNVKELLARNRRDVWSLCNDNGIRTHNRLGRKRTLNHLAEGLTDQWAVPFIQKHLIVFYRKNVNENFIFKENFHGAAYC